MKDVPSRESKDKIPSGLEEAAHEAERIAEDKERVLRLIKAASQKAGAKRRSINQMLDDLDLMFRLLRAWALGEYKAAPWKSIVAVTGAILYFLNPFDLVPDITPVFGHLDDIAVVGFVVAAVKADIDRFLLWEKERLRSAQAEFLPSHPSSS